MPRYRLRFTPEGAAVIADLESKAQYATKLKRVRKALGQLQRDPRYPSLNSHKYTSLHGVSGEDVWDSYVENNTPSAWRILWHYGPDDDALTILTIDHIRSRARQPQADSCPSTDGVALRQLHEPKRQSPQETSSTKPV